MNSNDVLVIGGIIFFIGFLIAMMCVASLSTIANNALEGLMDMEAYNLWSTVGYVGGAMMVAGAIIVVPISLLFATKKEAKK